MTKVVMTDKVKRYHSHITQVSRELSPEEASVVLAGILSLSLQHWDIKEIKMWELLLQDAHRLESRIRDLVMVKK